MIGEETGRVEQDRQGGLSVNQVRIGGGADLCTVGCTPVETKVRRG